MLPGQGNGDIVNEYLPDLDHDEIPLNPGIVRTVALLNYLGFTTVSSGDGATHACECDADIPFVVIDAVSTQAIHGLAAKLRTCLETRGLAFGSMMQREVDGETHLEHTGPFIEGGFDLGEGTAHIVLGNVKDSDIAFLDSDPA